MLLSRNLRLVQFLSQSSLNTAARAKNYGRPAMTPLTETLDESLASHGHQQPQNVKMTTLENGIRVVSTESEGGISKISVFVQAGSRYEDCNNLGITHVLRNTAYLSNKDRSALGIVREMQHNGVCLEATNSREHFIYSTAATRDAVYEAFANIAAAIRGPIFSHWEVSDAQTFCQMDRSNLAVNHQSRLLDNLHGTAYRNGLGNSMFCPEFKSYSGPQLQGHMENNFVGGRLLVAGVGCDHDMLVQSASSLLGNLPQGAPLVQQNQKYHGGESRTPSAGNLNHVALVAEGASHQSKDLLAFSLLQRLMGTSSSVKWGSNTVSSRLNRSSMDVATDPFMVTSLNIAHSDSGLFGFYSITSAKDTSKVLKSVLGEFRKVSKGDINEDEFNRSKYQLKASAMMTNEIKDAMLEDMAHQVLANGVYKTQEEICKDIDALKKDDLVRVAKQVFSGKATLAVLGECANAPYLDELL